MVKTMLSQELILQVLSIVGMSQSWSAKGERVEFHRLQYVLPFAPSYSSCECIKALVLVLICSFVCLMALLEGGSLCPQEIIGVVTALSLKRRNRQEKAPSVFLPSVHPCTYLSAEICPGFMCQ